MPGALQQVVPHQRDTRQQVSYALDGTPPYHEDDKTGEPHHGRWSRPAIDVVEEDRNEDKYQRPKDQRHTTVDQPRFLPGRERHTPFLRGADQWRTAAGAGRPGRHLARTVWTLHGYAFLDKV